MQTTLLARIGASRRTSASGHCRPVKLGDPNGCSAISLATASAGSSVGPSMLTKATPSGLAIRPRRMVFSLVAVTPAAGARHLSQHLELQFSILRQLCDDDRVSTHPISTARRWSMLVIALSTTL